jgi:hypothetical protein
MPTSALSSAILQFPDSPLLRLYNYKEHIGLSKPVGRYGLVDRYYGE